MFHWIFGEATARVRGQIQNDARRFVGDKEATRFLEYLERRLFDTSLDVQAWKKHCKISRRAADRVTAELGSLKTYLDQHRIQVAERLVRDTDLPIAQVGHHVGFAEARTFRRTFLRLLGQGPRQMRLLSSEAASMEPLVSNPEVSNPEVSETAVSEPVVSEPVVSVPLLSATEDGDFGPRVLARRWRRLVALGLCDKTQIGELREQFRLLYPRHGLFLFYTCGPDYTERVRVSSEDLPPDWRWNDPVLNAMKPTLLTLILDEKRSPAKLQSLFRQLWKNIFDQGLSLKKILRRVGGERSVWSSLRGVVGCAAWTYVREARLEAAARLLLFTSLTVKQICRKVGYASPPAFRSAFTRFAGMPPARYRSVVRRRIVGAGARPRQLDDQVFWEEAFNGELEDQAVWELDAYLERFANVVESELRKKC